MTQSIHIVEFSTPTHRCLPAAAEGVEELNERLKVCKPDLNQSILRGEERTLRIQHGEDIDYAGVELLLRDLVGTPCLGHRILLPPILFRCLLCRYKRVLDVAEGRDHRL